MSFTVCLCSLCCRGITFINIGLAESSGPHVVSVPGTLRAGSCGKTYLGTQIRLIPGSNEIILFGRNVFMGYLYDSAMTAEAVDDRGWLHTLVFSVFAL